jgi:hypothetical protein
MSLWSAPTQTDRWEWNFPAPVDEFSRADDRFVAHLPSTPVAQVRGCRLPRSFPCDSRPRGAVHFDKRICSREGEVMQTALSLTQRGYHS